MGITRPLHTKLPTLAVPTILTIDNFGKSVTNLMNDSFDTFVKTG
jgi:hypothetical protein